MSDQSSLILGTRGSALALAQAELVEAALHKVCPELQVVRKIIKTVGDARLDVSLSNPGSLDKGLFTKELEEALFRKEIDFAVHSLKDLPTSLPDGLCLSAVLPRADVEDVLVTKASGGLSALRPGTKVATGSPRRVMQLRELRPDLQAVDFRGNVPTRLKKLVENPDLGAIILAKAGLDRLGYPVGAGSWVVEGQTVYCSLLEQFLPAPGQGAIGLEARSNDDRTAQILRSIHHESTALAVHAEREILRGLGGGCHMALGARAIVQGAELSLTAILQISADGPIQRAQGIFSLAEFDQSLPQFLAELTA